MITVDQLRMADGRLLDVRVSGPAEGVALVFLHGTPGSRDPIRAWERAAHARGLRFVTTSRPGYGGSHSRPGRRVVDVVSDTATVLDAVGVRRCLVVGWSGGGPHALACAARLGGAAAVLSLAGFAPFDADGLDWFARLPEDSVAEFSAAARSADELRPLISQWRDELTDVTAGDLAVGLQPVFADGELAAVTEEFLEDQVRWVSDGFLVGVEGCVDDELAFTRPWGFDLDEISIPTVIAHGTADLLVPPAHGRWLASGVPGAIARHEKGEGHFSLTLRPLDRLLDELITLANGGR